MELWKLGSIIIGLILLTVAVYIAYGTLKASWETFRAWYIQRPLVREYRRVTGGDWRKLEDWQKAEFAWWLLEERKEGVRWEGFGPPPR